MTRTTKHRKPDWPRGLRALRELLADPDSTHYAFEVIAAVDPDGDLRALERLRSDPEGCRLLEDRPSLLDALSDRAALARLAEGSFGRAYLAFIERNALDPAGLVALSRDKSASDPRWHDAERAWIRDRGALEHDLWHVLVGYDADKMGEAELLPFSLAQSGGRANLIFTLGAFFRRSGAKRFETQRRMLRGWRRGRRARWLPALRYEELLAKPLDEVRAVAGID